MSESDTVFNERDRRCAAVQLMLSTDPSYDNRTIASTFKMQIWMVQHLRAQLNASDDPLEVVERKPKAEDTTEKIRTKEFIEKVQAIIDETPQQPIQQIARDLGVSHTTVKACVKEDLKCRSYRRQTSQILTEKTKNLRLIKSVRLLNKLEHPKKPNMLWFFSHEKHFCQDQVHNSQNHRWIAMNNRDMPRVMKTKFLAAVMVFGVVSSEGHITPSKSAWKSTPKCTWMCWSVWWSPGAIRWLVADPGCGSRTLRQPTSPKRPRLGFRKSATTLYLSLTSPLLPRPEPAGLPRLVTRREHQQHDLPQHQSQPDRCHPPSFRRRLWKSMLPVPDPYQGGDWGWRRLHWIYVSSTTQSSYLNWFFQ